MRDISNQGCKKDCWAALSLTGIETMCLPLLLMYHFECVLCSNSGTQLFEFRKWSSQIVGWARTLKYDRYQELSRKVQEVKFRKR